MRDIGTILQELESDGHFVNVTRNPLAQFGTRGRTYLGATLLPEREVPENSYTEQGIKFRTIIANDGTRYSPVQKKKGELVASMKVELGDSDIGRDISANEYEALLRLLRNGADMQTMERILRWSDTVLNRALVEKNELQIWQALILAQVVRQGDNGYTETVNYANPAGHRSNATGTWSDDSFDPFDDIFAKKQLLADKGFTVNRIVVPTPVVTILAGNAKVQARIGLPVINIGGTITVAQQQANLATINNALSANSLPALEVYDLQYRTSNSSGYFLQRNVMAMFATTGSDESIDLGDSEKLIQDTMGYLAVGKASGQPEPGRVLRVKFFDDKPPRIDGQAWQTTLPVPTEPEAIGVIGAIA